MCQDRHGIERFFGFTLLCMGAVPIAAGQGYRNSADLASAAALAKQRAKSQSIPVYLHRGEPVTRPSRAGETPLQDPLAGGMETPDALSNGLA